MEVWENEKLQREHEPIGRMFSHNFGLSQTFMSVPITYRNTGKYVFYFFYEIARRKLKRRNILFCQSVNSPLPFKMAYAMKYNAMNLSMFSIQL